MDGIILAGGAGTRMRPLTLDKPKPLLELQDRPILAWSLMSLRGAVDRVLVVVHHLKEQIAEFMAAQDIFADYRLVEQLPEPLGTGHALLCCRDQLASDGFLVVNGDDLYSAAALRELSRRDFGLLSTARADYEPYGVVLRNQTGDFLRIDEKPPPGTYSAPAACNSGAYKFTRAVFDYRLSMSERGEFEITDFVSAAARDHAVAVVESPFWLPIGDPAALAAAQSVDVARWIPQAPSR
ncbi:MAG: nucleotidyltransferase family protein [Chloroflexi bacterium]|nr:nucleotidyltransferase family protein [Chloroflexota bacterium]